MLQGAFTPPYCPAFPAQMPGSISLCGGARSTCAHPHSMSLGKNVRGWGFVSCESLAGAAVCALPTTEINRGTARIHANVFIQPPEFCVDREESTALRQPQTHLNLVALSNSRFGSWTGAEHCNLLAGANDSDRLRSNPRVERLV